MLPEGARTNGRSNQLVLGAYYKKKNPGPKILLDYPFKCLGICEAFKQNWKFKICLISWSQNDYSQAVLRSRTFAWLQA